MKWYFTAVVIVVLMAANWLSSSHALYCNTSGDCHHPYKNCCNLECSYRKFCTGFCMVENDCASNEYCIRLRCSDHKPDDYCDWQTTCYGAKKRCQNNFCVSYCDCTGNERCQSGKCVKKEPSEHSFTPASIIGFTAVVVIGSCIACVLYCGCARRGSQRTPQQQQQQQPQQQDQQSPREEPFHNVTRSTDPTGGSVSPPVLPGGPPPYHSLEMIDRLKNEPPPPSYQEAMRNSQNDLNV